jgi:hypothetical protein
MTIDCFKILQNLDAQLNAVKTSESLYMRNNPVSSKTQTAYNATIAAFEAQKSVLANKIKYQKTVCTDAVGQVSCSTCSKPSVQVAVQNPVFPTPDLYGGLGQIAHGVPSAILNQYPHLKVMTPVYGGYPAQVPQATISSALDPAIVEERKKNSNSNKSNVAICVLYYGAGSGYNSKTGYCIAPPTAK